MKNFNFKNILPHLIAVVIFLLIAVVYCLPVFQGMVVYQHDMLGTKGMTQQSIEFYDKYGYYPLWTNSMFGGMPAFQILFGAKYNIGIGWMHSLFTLFLPSPASLFFLSCITFYILTQVLKLKPWIGILGALAYSFASYNAIIAMVGHVTKFATMGYAPLVLAGVILLMQRKYIWGFALTLIASTLFFNQNHVQIVYYFMLLFVCLGISFLIQIFKTKDFKHLIKAASLAFIAVAIGVCSFAVILLPTKEYAKETMRGGRTELKDSDEKENLSEGGLKKDYAFQWSYGKQETFTFILPGYLGGSNDPAEFGENSKVIAALQESGLPNEAINYFYRYMSPYWGDQPNTAGPVYLGAIVCMLFIAGLFFVPKRYLCWLIPATIIGIVLAWGSNFSAVNYFLFDHLPAYNKFRAPSMALVLPQFTFALIASLTLQQIFYGNLQQDVLYKKLKYSAIACGAVLLILTAVYLTSSFSNEKTKEARKAITEQLTQSMSRGKPPTAEMTSQANTMASSFNKALIEDRKGLFGADLLRLFIFFALGGLIIWLGSRKKISPLAAISLLALISFIDLIGVSSRYLNKSKYATPEDYLSGFTPTAADNQIKMDTSYFRVFDQSSGNPFEDSRTSYFHNSVGGYSPAKLGLYNDLIEQQLTKGNMEVFNMLNTKYFIVNGQNNQPIAQVNPGANGPVWFVKGIKYVEGGDAEMKALDSLHTKDSVVIDKREQSKITVSQQYDSSASIKLIKNLNDKVTYESRSSTNQFAVFSEIYYPNGWKAYIDGKETPIVRVDYLLRGLNIPAGNHTIQFDFAPSSYNLGNMVSLIAGIVSIIALLICAFLLFRQSRIPIITRK
ncbi:MAG: YfhO family protein [Ferruginibacter sp.]|nr:YfhO family protein [Ferruginibacter sp.]